MKRRLLPLVLSVCMATSMIASTFAAASTDAAFTDVSASHWSYSFVQTAAENSLVSGMGDGTYGVSSSVSNAQWATMICNLLYKDDLAAYSAGTGSAWWTAYVEVANSKAVLRNTALLKTGNNWSLADTACNRYDMAQTIYNVAQQQTWLLNYPVNSANTPDEIADWDSIPTEYQSAVRYAYAAGFLAGVDDSGTFSGAAAITRGAAAVVLCRLLEAKNGTYDFKPNNAAGMDDPVTPEVPTALSVADRITLTQDGSRTKITVDAPYVAGKLSNGKDITQENILAMLAELEVVFPAGTSWGDGKNGTLYSYSGKRWGGGGGCNAWAYMTADLLFGRDAVATSHTDLANVKVGDVVHLYNAETKADHWVVVTGTGTDTVGYPLVYTCEGNVNAKVAWSEHFWTATMKKYPNSTVYSFYN